jgi:type III secretion protein J
MIPTVLRTSVLALCLFVLAACNQQEVFTGLTESEANEIAATLLSNGVEATKTTVTDKGVSISVGRDNFLAAIKILKDNGLPRPVKEDLGTIFKKSGITSTPFEERVRFTYGLSQEIEKTLNTIDGVVIARVHLVIPESPEFGKEVRPSSASVFIKYKAGTDIEFLTPQIRRLVANAIDGLNYAAVNVATVEAQPAVSVFKAVEGETYGRVGGDAQGIHGIFSDWRNIVLMFIGVLIVPGGGVFGFLQFRKMRATKPLEETQSDENN